MRLETYSVLAAAILCENGGDDSVVTGLVDAIVWIAHQYISRYGEPDRRYARDPLRPFAIVNGLPHYRGVHSHFARGAEPDLGCTAMLYRVLRSPFWLSHLKEAWRDSKIGPDQARFLLEEDLIDQYDRYLVAPQLFAMTHPGMFASLLVNDEQRLHKELLDTFEKYLDNGWSTELRSDTIFNTISEKYIDELIEELIAKDINVDPNELQLSTISLTKLIVEKTRPGRYADDSKLDTVGCEKVCQETSSVYKNKAFMLRYDNAWGRSPDHTIAKPFLNMLEPESLILDVGCGPGQYSVLFRGSGHKVALLDVSKAALKIAKTRLNDIGYSAQAIEADITKEGDWLNTSLRREQFHAIWCSGIMAHMPRTKWIEILSRFRTVLKSSGILFVNVMLQNPCLFSRDGRFFTYLKSSSDFEAALGKCGFNVEYSLAKRVGRNTFQEPLLETSWVNFYASGVKSPDIEDEAVAAATAMTSFAYGRSAKRFNQEHIRRVNRNEMVCELLNTLQHHLRGASDPKVLDAGCGTGDVLVEASKRGLKPFGVDISEKMLEFALAASEGLPCPAEIKLCDVCSLPSAWTNNFDALICMTTLQHLPIRGGKFERALSEFRRVLKLGGIARVDVRLGFDSGFDPDLRYIQTFESIQDAMDYILRAGFEEVKPPRELSIDAGVTTFKRPVEINFAELWLRAI